MFDKLIHRNQPNPPEDLDKQIENEITELQTRIDGLETQSASLHSRIMATKRPSTRTDLQLARSEILSKIRIYTTRKDAQIEIQASIKTNQLLHKTLSEQTMILQVNGHRTKIPKDLIISLKYAPCRHVKKLHIKNLLSYRKHIPTTNIEAYLLTKWQATLTTNTTITSSYNCDQCRQAKQRKFMLTHRHSRKDIIGICHLTLSIA